MNEAILSYEKEKLLEAIDKVEYQYSDDKKKEFLRYINQESEPKTTKLCLNVMKKIDSAEYEFKKEWYKMSEDQINTALCSLESTSIITLQSHVSITKRYLAITTPSGDTMNRGFHYTMGLNKDDLKKFVSAIGKENKYITPKEFDKYIKYSKAPDLTKATAILIYLGVKGFKFSDLCNLKTRDINMDTGEIAIGDRVDAVIIPKNYLKYFINAHSTTVYNQVDHEGKIEAEREVELDTPYFVKRTVSKNNDPFKQPDAAVISKIMMDFQRSIKNQYVNGLSLYVSGEVYRLIEFCDMEMPTSRKLTKYREVTGSKLSFVTMNEAADIILNKIKKNKRKTQ